MDSLLTFLRARSHSEGSCPSNTCLSHMPVTRDARFRLSQKRGCIRCIQHAGTDE